MCKGPVELGCQKTGAISPHSRIVIASIVARNSSVFCNLLLSRDHLTFLILTNFLAETAYNCKASEKIQQIKYRHSAGNSLAEAASIIKMLVSSRWLAVNWDHQSRTFILATEATGKVYSCEILLEPALAFYTDGPCSERETRPRADQAIVRMRISVTSDVCQILNQILS